MAAMGLRKLEERHALSSTTTFTPDKESYELKGRPLTPGSKVEVKNGDLLFHPDTPKIIRDGVARPIAQDVANYLNEAFPSGIRETDFRQGQIGDCPLLASLKATMHSNPNAIADRVKAVNHATGEIIYQFGNREVVVNRHEVGKAHASKGPEGVRLYELALGRYFKEEGNVAAQSTDNLGPQNNVRAIESQLRRYDTGRALNTGDQFETLGVLNRTDHHKPFMAPKGKVFGDCARTQAAVEQRLRAIAENPEHNIGIALTVDKGQDPVRQDPKYVVAHVYGILSVDPAQRTINLSNPHDTSKPLQASYSEFMKNFVGIHTAYSS